MSEIGTDLKILEFRNHRTTPLDKIEDDIEEDREGRSKDEMDEKYLIKTVPNCKMIFGSEVDQGPYTN